MAGGELLTLQQHVVEEARGAEAEQVRLEPLLPTVSATVTRYLIASFEERMPPAGFTPIFSPVARCQSRTVSSMSSVVGRVAAGCTFPVEVLMKSPPARMPSHDARLMLSYVFSSPVSRMTLSEA